MIKDMTAMVRKSTSKSRSFQLDGRKNAIVTNLGRMLRSKLNDVLDPNTTDPEIAALKPLFDMQMALSHIPKADEFLIEQIETKDGYHLFVHMFEGDW
jgi:ATP-dependent Lhr-like helicase